MSPRPFRHDGRGQNLTCIVSCSRCNTETRRFIPIRTILAMLKGTVRCPACGGGRRVSLGRQVTVIKNAKKYDFSITFGPEYIEPGETKTVIVQMGSRLFRGEDLVNEGEDDDLFIDRLLVGSMSQLPTGGVYENGAVTERFPLSVKTCRKRTLSSGVKFDTCQPGLFMQIVVTNKSKCERRLFKMTIPGKAVDCE